MRLERGVVSGKSHSILGYYNGNVWLNDSEK